MHGAGVQWMGAIPNSQKPRRLLEGLGTQARDFLQGFPGSEGAVTVPVLHDSLGQPGTQARNVGEQLAAGGVQLHAHIVDATAHHIVQAFLEGLLVDIVLVLAHTDGLGVYLDQFGQGVHEAAADGNSPPDGNVLIGKLSPRHLRG